MKDLMDFLLYLVDAEKEKDLWEMWLHKETEFPNNFEKFKKKYLKPVNKNKKVFTKEDEEKAIQKAQNILNIGGAKNRGNI